MTVTEDEKVSGKGKDISNDCPKTTRGEAQAEE